MNLSWPFLLNSFERFCPFTWVHTINSSLCKRSLLYIVSATLLKLFLIFFIKTCCCLVFSTSRSWQLVTSSSTLCRHMPLEEAMTYLHVTTILSPAICITLKWLMLRHFPNLIMHPATYPSNSVVSRNLIPIATLVFGSKAGQITLDLQI